MSAVGVQRPGAGLRAPATPPRSVALVRETLPLTVGDIPVVGVAPSEVDLLVYQGDDLKWSIPVLQGGDPADFSGCTLEAQIRTTPEDDTILATLTTSVSSNTVSFWLAAVDSAGLPKTGGVWDAQVTDGDGIISTFVAGKVTVIEQVTR